MSNIVTDEIVTKCNHKFHKLCLDDWLNKHDRCPNCRENLKPERDIMRSEINNKFSDIGASLVMLSIEFKNGRYSNLIPSITIIWLNLNFISKHMKTKIDFTKILYLEMLCFFFTIISLLLKFSISNLNWKHLISSLIYVFFLTFKCLFNFTNIITETKMDICFKLIFSLAIINSKSLYLPLYLLYNKNFIPNLLCIIVFYMDIVHFCMIIGDIGILYKSPVAVQFRDKIKDFNYN